MSTPARESRVASERLRRRVTVAAIGTGFIAMVAVAITGLGAPPPSVEDEALAAGPDAGTLPFVTQAQQGKLSPPDLDDVEQMCALLTGCTNLPIPPGVVPPDFGACVKKMSEELTAASGVGYSMTLRECGLKANSCDALKSCALRGADSKACDGRGAKAPIGYCDESGRALTCYQGKVWLVRNCPFGGEQCRVSAGAAGASAQCILGPCSSDAGDVPYCSQSGTRVLQCDRGKLTSLDCAAFGLQCSSFKGADGGPSVGCSTGTTVCSGTAKRCDGKTAVACHNGHEVRVDCAAAGLICDTNPSSPTVGACVVAPSSVNCSPSDAAKCDGKAIKYCASGRQRSYLCSTLFSSCQKDGAAVHCSK